MSEQLQPIENEVSAPDWNRTEVNRCMLPVLRMVDSEQEEISDEEREQLLQQALVACHSRVDTYRQLVHVWNSASEQALEQWFGGIDCDTELMEAAFDFIGKEINGQSPYQPPHISFEHDMYFSGLFRITDEGAPVDLAYPFEQYYFCDGVIYQDYLYRRIELADKCKAWIRRYLPYYNHIHAWYRDNGGKDCAVSPEHHAYMELFGYFIERIHYEDRLQNDRKALEYERGGLGWFHFARKREIARELYDLDLEEYEMRLSDTREKFEAYVAQFDKQREDWQNELAHAPLTAFGRKKELKQKLAALEEQIKEYRKELALEDMQAQFKKMCKKRKKR